MKLQFSDASEALYIKLTDEPVSRTAEVDSGTLVDLDRLGRIVGIEVVRPNRTWPLAEIAAEYSIDSHVKHMLELYSDRQAASSTGAVELIAS